MIARTRQRNKNGLRKDNNISGLILSYTEKKNEIFLFELCVCYYVDYLKPSSEKRRRSFIFRILNKKTEHVACIPVLGTQNLAEFGHALPLSIIERLYQRFCAPGVE